MDVLDFKFSWERVHVMQEKNTFSRGEVLSMSHLVTFLVKFEYC